MNADVILTMSWILKLHVICALVALFLGPIALFYSKQSRTHKCIGYVWMIGMSITAITSFWITEIKPGHFSAVHVLSVFALGSIVHAFVAIRNGNIKAHRATLRNLYIFGTFTVNFLPGRTLPSAFLNGGDLDVVHGRCDDTVQPGIFALSHKSQTKFQNVIFCSSHSNIFSLSTAHA